MLRVFVELQIICCALHDAMQWALCECLGGSDGVCTGLTHLTRGGPGPRATEQLTEGHSREQGLGSMPGVPRPLELPPPLPWCRGRGLWVLEVPPAPS